MKINRYQFILATGWIPVCWQWIWAIGSVCWVVGTANVNLASLREWSYFVSVAVVVLLSFLTGWFASIIPGWFAFGPILYSQGLENGGPFLPGDTVRVIAGRHRDTVARVYDGGKNETVRVELGEKEKERYADYFAAYELVREGAVERVEASRLPVKEL